MLNEELVSPNFLIFFVLLIISLIGGFIFFSVFIDGEKKFKDKNRICESFINPLCFIAMVLESVRGLPVYCLNEKGKRQLKIGTIFMYFFLFSSSLIGVYYDGGKQADYTFFFLLLAFILFSEGFKRYSVELKMVDVGFEDESIDKFTCLHCKRMVPYLLILGIIMLIFKFIIVGQFVDVSVLSRVRIDYSPDNYYSLIKKDNKMKLMKIMGVKSERDEKFRERTKSFHKIKGKYVYVPLFSMFMSIDNAKNIYDETNLDWGDIANKLLLKRNYGWRYFILWVLLRVIIFFVVVYFLIFRVNLRFYKREGKKIEDKVGKERVKKFIKEVKILELSLFGLILFTILFINRFQAYDVDIDDLIVITHYSKITDKKLSSLSDKIKKLNIKTDKQLSEAIREGKISVSNVLDSTLTIQIEDSRLDKNIKKELLNYYRQNYEKYRYRIINGYLIDFIHGKYRKIKPKAIFKASKHQSFFKTVLCKALQSFAFYKEQRVEELKSKII